MPKAFGFASFSGGRSSGRMLRLLQELGRLPPVFFCNTGLESLETYAFIEAVNEQWLGGSLVCLEFCLLDGKRSYRQVPVKELDRTGKPFLEMVQAAKMLPSARRRICTDELKVRTIFRHIYATEGEDVEIEGAIGLRADEPARIARINASNDAYEARLAQGKRPLKWSQSRDLPLVRAGIDRQAVLDYYAANPLEGLAFEPADPGLHLSNCPGCIYSNLEEKVKTAMERPAIAKVWMEIEDVFFRHQTRFRNPAPPARARWIRKHLGREMDPADEQELEGQAINVEYLWKHLDEYARLTKAGKTQHAIPLLDLRAAQAGGCESGECGLDV